MINLNYNFNGSGLQRSLYTEQESRGFRKFQLQYIIVPPGGGSAAGNNSFNSGSDLPKVGIAGNGGVIVTGSYCVQPLTNYSVTVGYGGAGGFATSQSLAWTGSDGGTSSFYDVIANGGYGGKSQVYITSSTFAGNGALTSASIQNGGSGSQWTYNLPGCLPTPFDPTCHGGDLNSSSYYSGGGAGIAVSQSFTSPQPIGFMYLIIGGGGSGNSKPAIVSNTFVGGGAGGAVLSGSYVIQQDPNWTSYIVGDKLIYPIKVGVGGAQTLNSDGINGVSSSAFAFSAQGGKGAVDVSGGNSGTGSANSNFTTGFTGGATNGGGGAGARANGTSGIDLGGGIWDGGDGGNGALWSGSYYAGGGGGAVNVGGGTSYGGSAGLGAANAGGGGGGQFNSPSSAGISGSVIIKYNSTGLGNYPQKITGGQITYDGPYVIHTFTSSGQLEILAAIPTLDVEYIVVGGGGGGMNNTDTCNQGKAFGGGGGAAISGSFLCEPIVRTYPIIIGAGGIGKYGCTVVEAYDGTGSAAFGVLAGGGERANGGNSGGDSGTGSWGLTVPFVGSDGGAGAAANGNPLINLGGGLWTGGNGGSGLQWVDGNYYAGGGGGGTQNGAGTQGTYGQTTLQYGYYPGRGGSHVGNDYNVASNGNSGSVVVRYPGTGSKATGGIISYDVANNYTYHFFSQSGNFTLNENTSSLFTSGLPGVGSGNALFSPSGSLTLIPNTGGGAAASYYNQNGVSGSNGFVALRYQGAPLATGGTVVTTEYYTYHFFSSSADFYVIGQESNPNINPCP
jgi:hypothetical protein